jgi:osmotically-inducible protein OsmY
MSLPFAKESVLPSPQNEPQEECVARLVESRLRQSGYSGLWSVTCEFREGAATLRGAVPSFYLKQLAQALARQTEGVRQVINRIDVAQWSAGDDERRES